MVALGREAQFLYSIIDTYRFDAEKANRSDLVNMWNTIKEKGQMLRESLEQEAKEERLRK
jgi:hypothetical protein